MHRKTIKAVDGARAFEKAARMLRQYAAADEDQTLYLREATAAARKGSRHLETLTRKQTARKRRR